MFANPLTIGVFGDCLQIFCRLLNLQPNIAFWSHAEKSILLWLLLLLGLADSFPNFIFGLKTISLSDCFWETEAKWLARFID